jgi:transcriptional regulator
MYTREHFSLPLEAMAAFVRRKSFGILATTLDGQVFTSPLPLDLRGEEPDGLFVAAHIARANDMLAAFEHRPHATITVMGPDSFIPAEWFGTRSRIPTWLYCAVELSGRLEPSDPDLTRQDVLVMMDRLQKRSVEGSTWTLDEIPAHLSDGYLQNIAGFRIHELTLKSCFRLNQNKDHGQSLAAVLAEHPDPACRELAPLVTQPPTLRKS